MFSYLLFPFHDFSSGVLFFFFSVFHHFSLFFFPRKYSFFFLATFGQDSVRSGFHFTLGVDVFPNWYKSICSTQPCHSCNKLSRKR